MVKLFSKNSNLCDHNSPTSQTDRPTDRQTTCDRNTALCTKVHRAVKKLTRLHNSCIHISQRRIAPSCTISSGVRSSCPNTDVAAGPQTVATTELQCESKKSPCGFLTFFPKRLGIFNQLYVPFYALDYKFLFNNQSPTLTKLCHSKPDFLHVITT